MPYCWKSHATAQILKKSLKWKLIKIWIHNDYDKCSFAIKVLRSFRVTALCNFKYCLDSACMRNSTPPINFFQENSDTMYTQRRD